MSRFCLPSRLVAEWLVVPTVKPLPIYFVTYSMLHLPSLASIHPHSTPDLGMKPRETTDMCASKAPIDKRP